MKLSAVHPLLQSFVVDGKNVIPEVHAVLDKVKIVHNNKNDHSINAGGLNDNQLAQDNYYCNSTACDSSKYLFFLYCPLPTLL